MQRLVLKLHKAIATAFRRGRATQRYLAAAERAAEFEIRLPCQEWTAGVVRSSDFVV